MRKGIELPKETIESLLNGASMFVVPIELDSKKFRFDEFYVQEMFDLLGRKGKILYKTDFSEKEQKVSPWQDASQMTEEQSRVKGNAVNIEVKKVQDINVNKIYSTKDKKYFEKFTYHCSTEPINFKRHRGFKEYLKKIGINYDDNPYVFLYTIEKEG